MSLLENIQQDAYKTNDVESDEAVSYLLNTKKIDYDMLINAYSISDRWAYFRSKAFQEPYNKCLARYELLVIRKGYELANGSDLILCKLYTYVSLFKAQKFVNQLSEEEKTYFEEIDRALSSSSEDMYNYNYPNNDEFLIYSESSIPNIILGP